METQVIEKKDKPKVRNLCKATTESGRISGVASYCEAGLSDDEFLQKLDADPDVLNFRNGIYNLTKDSTDKSKFRARVQSDYVSKCLSLDWTPSTKELLDELEEVFFQISNSDNETLQFNLDFFGYCLTGRVDGQFWYLALGATASNGKSTMAELFEESLPIYCCKLNSDTFNINYGKFHKQVASIVGKRFAYVEELSKVKLDINKIKEWITASYLTNEVMYGTVKAIRLLCKLYATSNNEIRFDSDAGFKRRGLSNSFTNVFTYTPDEKKTNQIQAKPWRTTFEENPEYQLALINLLIPRAYQFYQNRKNKLPGVKIPQKFRDNFHALCDQNDKIEEFLAEHYDITNELCDKVSKFEFEDFWQTYFKCKTPWSIMISDVKKKDLKFDPKARCSYNGKSMQGVIYGIKRKEDEEVQEANELDF